MSAPLPHHKRVLCITAPSNASWCNLFQQKSDVQRSWTHPSHPMVHAADGRVLRFALWNASHTQHFDANKCDKRHMHSLFTILVVESRKVWFCSCALRPNGQSVSRVANSHGRHAEAPLERAAHSATPEKDGVFRKTESCRAPCRAPCRMLHDCCC